MVQFTWQIEWLDHIGTNEREREREIEKNSFDTVAQPTDFPGNIWQNFANKVKCHNRCSENNILRIFIWLGYSYARWGNSGLYSQ